MQRPILFLRSLAAILAGIVALCFGYEPRIVGDAVGITPIFNWLLLGYGLPALSFWMASIFLRRRGDDVPLRTVESAAIRFTVLLVFLEISHAINGGDVYRHILGLTETALHVCAALAMAIGLQPLGSAPAASSTMSPPCCSRFLPGWPRYLDYCSSTIRPYGASK